MMNWLAWVHPPTESSLPGAFGPGDEVRVWYWIREQGKEWLGQFSGTVLRVRGSGPSRTFTVRRVTYGEGVERVFLYDTKVVDRVEVLRAVKPTRSRLYYLRRVTGKRRLASEAQPVPADSSQATPSGVVAPSEPSSSVSVTAPTPSEGVESSSPRTSKVEQAV